MSFLNSLRKAFGLTPETDDVIADDIDATPSTSSAPTEDSAQEGTPRHINDGEVPTVSAEMKGKIFEHVVAVFNQSLPDFLSKSVDPAAQRRLLVESLDRSTTEYLNGLMAEAERYAEARLKNAVENSRRESERLTAQMQALEQQRNTLREQQLSADRRRRATDDKLTLLEQRLADVEAEREQYELENKSLLNKLKVAEIQPGVVDDLTKELESLRKQVAEGGKSETVVDNTLLDAAKAETEAVKAELAEKSRLLDETTDALEILQKNNAELKAANERYLAEEENLRTSMEMSQTMYNDMQQKFVTEREQREAMQNDIAEAQKILAQVGQLQQQFAQVEDIIRKRDERIERLKSTNKKLKDEVANLKEQLSMTPSTGLFGISNEAYPNEDAVVPEMAALEDDFVCPEWFVSTPAPNQPSLRVEDPSFGYSEPPRKPRQPDNEAQLSLF